MKRTEWDESLPLEAEKAFRQATDSEKEEAIRHATEFVETLPFKGKKVDEAQSLSWPRTGVNREDGAPITGIPHEIKEATALVAGFILAKVPFDTPAVAWVFSKIGHLIEDDFDVYDVGITWH